MLGEPEALPKDGDVMQYVASLRRRLERLEFEISEKKDGQERKRDGVLVVPL